MPYSYPEDKKKDIFDSICQRIIEGEAVRNILKDKDMPSMKTFWDWLDKDEDLVKQYARAKELYAERMFEDIILISDGTGDDILVDEDGKEQVNWNVIQRDKLRSDNRKWVLSKLNPKKYGDRLQLDQNKKDIPITEEELLKELEKIERRSTNKKG